MTRSQNLISKPPAKGQSGPKKRRGFTLVEIMIVVAIIGILLGVAIPAWISVRKRSYENMRAANCVMIDRAKEQWIQETGQAATAEPTAGDLEDYVKTFPTDPSGTYQINPGNVPCVYVPN